MPKPSKNDHNGQATQHPEAVRAAWDAERNRLLAMLRAPCGDGDAEVLSDDEIMALVREELPEQLDRVPEPPKRVVTRPGDLWMLGEHRLLCGSCLKEEDVASLCGGELISLIVTSPPYNQSLQSMRLGSKGLSSIHADNSWFNRLDTAYEDSLPDDVYQQQQVVMLNLWYKFVRDGGAMFYNHKHRYRGRSPIIPLDWVRRSKSWQLRQEIIWDRRGGVAFNAGMFVPGEERIYWLEKDGEHTWHSGHGNRTNVWPISPQKNNGSHVCPYPVELVSIPVAAVSDKGDVVADPYCGSGTTLVAAHRLERRFFGMEIDPRYCDVTLQRWVTMTGLNPVREDGRTWTDLLRQ